MRVERSANDLENGVVQPDLGPVATAEPALVVG